MHEFNPPPPVYPLGNVVASPLKNCPVCSGKGVHTNIVGQLTNCGCVAMGEEYDDEKRYRIMEHLADIKQEVLIKEGRAQRNQQRKNAQPVGKQKRLHLSSPAVKPNDLQLNF